MKILIMTDIPGNYHALRALPDDYDELCDLDDLLDYRPQPEEVLVKTPDVLGLIDPSEPAVVGIALNE